MRKTTLDWLKILCAVMVVYIHSYFQFSWGRALVVPCRIAVPVFFISSGYFFRAKGQPAEPRRVRKRVLRLLKLLFIYGVLLFIISIFAHSASIHRMPNLAEWSDFLRSYTTPVAILRFIFLGDMWGASYVLWYIIALIWCELLGMLAERLRLTRFFHILCIPCLLLAIAAEITGNISGVYVRSAWVCGFWLFMVGDMIREHEDSLRRYLSRKRLWILLGIAAALAVFEADILNRVDFYLSSLLGSISLTLLALNSDYQPTDRIPAHILPQISLYIYLLHNIYAFSIGFLFPQYKCILNWLKFPITLTLTLLTAAAIIFIKEKRRLRKKDSASC